MQPGIERHRRDSGRGERLLAAFGVVSLLCVLLYWPALHDIWRAQGAADYWRGDGPAAVEWRSVSLLYWPILLFHLAYLARFARRATARARPLG